MIGRHAFYRTAVLALGVSAPSLILLASLAARGLLAVGAGLIAGAATLVATGLIVGRTIAGLARVRAAVDVLAVDDKAATLASELIRHLPAGQVGELWLAILRLTRAGSDRIRSAEARLAAAEAVIAAIPDPLILLNERR